VKKKDQKKKHKGEDEAEATYHAEMGWCNERGKGDTWRMGEHKYMVEKGCQQMKKNKEEKTHQMAAA
jgi:uncharacterized protein (UPF0128 family)